MTKLQQNFEMWSGDHKNLNFGVTGSDGAAFILTAASWVLSEAEDSCSLVKRVSGDGVSISGSTVTVSLSPAHTSGLGGISYYHVLKGGDSASNVSTVAVGTINIKVNIV
jgi:hypothetical protein